MESVIITGNNKFGRIQRARNLWGSASGQSVNTPADRIAQSPQYLTLLGKVDGKGVTKFQTQAGNTNTDTPDSILLDKNDVFIATAYALGIRRYDPVSNTHSSEPIFFYPSAAYFDGVLAPNAPEWKALMSLYGGTHQIKTGTTVLCEGRLNMPFLKVPNAPYVTAGNILAETNIQDAMVDFCQEDVFWGNQNYDITFNFGTANGGWLISDGSRDAAGAARTSRNELVLIIEGLRIVGGAGAKLQIDKF